MTASAAMITQVRAWVKEPTTTPYTDAEIRVFIERYPLTDERGVDPYWYDTSTEPPTQTATDGWYPTYDLHAAAADIWDEKAALLADTVDRPHQGPTPAVHRETQPRDFAAQRARYHRSRRNVRSGKLIASPSRNRLGNSFVGNLAEIDP